MRAERNTGPYGNLLGVWRRGWHNRVINRQNQGVLLVMKNVSLDDDRREGIAMDYQIFIKKLFVFHEVFVRIIFFVFTLLLQLHNHSVYGLAVKQL